MNNHLHSTEHLQDILKNNLKENESLICSYLQHPKMSLEWLKLIVDSYSDCVWNIENWHHKFNQNFNFNCLSQFHLVKPILPKNAQLMIRICENQLVPFPLAYEQFQSYSPSVKHSANGKSLSLALALNNRPDAPCEFEGELLTTLCAEDNVFSYLIMFENYFFKLDASVDLLVSTLIKQGFRASTRLHLLKKFSDHPQIITKHKVLFLEELSKLRHDKHFSSHNELSFTYEFIKDSLGDEVPTEVLVKLLW